MKCKQRGEIVIGVIIFWLVLVFGVTVISERDRTCSEDPNVRVCEQTTK